MINSKLGISKDFAYFLKQEHLYSNYRAYIKKKDINYNEYKYWASVTEKFYIFLVTKYGCLDSVILN
jgi:hypothetical protein